MTFTINQPKNKYIEPGFLLLFIDSVHLLNNLLDNLVKNLGQNYFYCISQ